MAVARSLLDEIQIAAPCPASWDAMAGTDRVRHCRECGLNVYDVSAMTRSEAEALVAAREGRPCIRLFRRGDGTVLTQNCPVGMARLKLAARRGGAAVVAGFFSVLALILALLSLQPRARGGKDWAGPLREVEPFKTVLDWVDPRPTCVMGVPVMPPVPPATGLVPGGVGPAKAPAGRSLPEPPQE
jgi:hypothetical protein